ncbi:hypothetical protein ACFE04_025070 [Oxalis oulophora]
MADSGVNANNNNNNTTSFSQLLFNQHQVVGLDYQSNFSSYSFGPDQKSPKMLCFGNFQQSQPEEMLFGGQRENNVAITNQISALTCIDPNSSPSSVNKKTNKSDRRRKGSNQDKVQCPKVVKTSPPQRSGKRSKTVNPTTTTSHAKVRKEKLGERITALQQLVSPFGKTDTASVLHEAMGYIKFLHDQVQVLCSPYLQHNSPNSGDQTMTDLRSKGLCLVPVACTSDMANNNGADFWSPIMSHAIVSSTEEK